MRYFIMFFLIIVSHDFIIGQESYFTPENILKYASNLKNEGDFLRAADEYQRFIFLNKDSASEDSIYYLIGKCYQQGSNFELANKYYNHNFKSPILIEETRYQKAVILTKQDQFKKSVDYVDSVINKITFNSIKAKMNILKGFDYINLHNWEFAKRQIDGLVSDKSDNQSIRQLSEIIEKGENLKYKSPLFAGLFSAIVPGSGKLYTGKKQDALYSFLLTSICYWQAYDGFHKQGINSFKGWAYFAVGTVFYTGNIYGSIVSAKIYNQRIKDDLVHQLNVSIYF